MMSSAYYRFLKRLVFLANSVLFIWIAYQLSYGLGIFPGLLLWAFGIVCFCGVVWYEEKPAKPQALNAPCAWLVWIVWVVVIGPNTLYSAGYFLGRDALVGLSPARALFRLFLFGFGALLLLTGNLIAGRVLWPGRVVPEQEPENSIGQSSFKTD
jgi:hypothetical protein